MRGARARVRAMAQPPPLSDEQRRLALEKAAVARRIRAAVKEQLRAGEVSLGELFERANDDEVVAKTKVLPLLESLPGVGKVKARRAMSEIGIAESRRIRGLGDQQRSALVEMFP